MKAAVKICLLLILTGFFLSVAGCISHQSSATSQQSYTIQSSIIPSYGTISPRYWIRIDPIQDFKTDSNFNITGSTIMNVNGTTEFPAGAILDLSIIEMDRDRVVNRTSIVIRSNNSGPNTFSYIYDMVGNPPDRYQVGIVDPINLNGGLSFFNITSDKSYYKWIHMNPIGEVHLGDNIPISGTTDLPAGSEIMIRTDIVQHSCTMATPDRFGARSLCGGSCRDIGSKQTIMIVPGTGEINTWNSTVITTDWCLNEEFWIGAFAINWTNVTPGGQSIRLRS